jgi:TetR/AcrR family transcriptional regulator, copper-responsive repressor
LAFQNRVEPTEVVNAATHYCRRRRAAVNCTSPEVQQSLRDLLNESLGQLEKVFDNAIRAGELDPGADARALAVLISLVMQGMAQQARDGATRDEL